MYVCIYVYACAYMYLCMHVCIIYIYIHTPLSSSRSSFIFFFFHPPPSFIESRNDKPMLILPVLLYSVSKHFCIKSRHKIEHTIVPDACIIPAPVPVSTVGNGYSGFSIMRRSWTSSVNWLPGGRFGCFLKLCVHAFRPKFGRT
jgi:hypothetical protein